MHKRLAWATAVLLICLAVAFRLAGGELTPAQLAAQVRAAGTLTWGPPLFVGLYLLGTTLFVPAVVFHIAAGALWGFWVGAALSCLAMNLASNLQFLAARAVGAAPLERFLAGRGLERVFARASAEGPWLMMVVRQLPLPFNLVNAAAGLSPMPWWHFLVGSGLGGTVPLLVWTWFASQVLATSGELGPGVLLRVFGAGLAVLGVAALGREVMRRRAERSAAAR